MLLNRLRLRKYLRELSHYSTKAIEDVQTGALQAKLGNKTESTE